MYVIIIFITVTASPPRFNEELEEADHLSGDPIDGIEVLKGN